MMPEHLEQPYQDPIETASQKAASHITVALAVAQRYIDTHRRRLADKWTGAEPAGTDPWQVYAVMLGRDKGATATSQQALAAWAAAQPLRDQHRDGDLAATRAEDRLRQLHPDAMTRFDALRRVLDPVQAMREIAPLIAADTLANNTDADVEQQDALDHDELAEANAADERSQAGPDGNLDPAHGREHDRSPDYTPAVRAALDPELASAVLADPRWTELGTALNAAERAGADATQLLRDAAAQREMATAKYPAQVLRTRITTAGPAGASFPVPVTAISLPAEAVAAAPDPALVAVAVELASEAARSTDTASQEAENPDVVSAATGPVGAASFPAAITDIPLTQAIATATAPTAGADAPAAFGQRSAVSTTR